MRHAARLANLYLLTPRLRPWEHALEDSMISPDAPPMIPREPLAGTPAKGGGIAYDDLDGSAAQSSWRWEHGHRSSH